MAHFRDRRAFGNVGTRRFRGARYGDGKSPRFQGLLDLYGGAAAAYSLRALSAGWVAGDVVEVRPSSGWTPASFTANQVANGELVDYVKRPGNFTNVAINPFEEFANNGEGDGFTAKNSVSGGFASSTSASGVTSDSVTIDFDVAIVSGSPSVSLRTSSNTTSSNIEVVTTSGSYSFILTATDNFDNFSFADGDIPSEFTVSNVRVSTNDGYVSTWYDQSGNANDATQITTTSQPKIVDAGALVTGGLDFDGVDDELNTSLIPPSTATLIGVATWDIEVATQMIFGARDSTNERSYLAQTSSGNIALGVGPGAIGVFTATASTEYIAFGKYNSGDNDIYVNGSLIGSGASASPANTTYGYNIGSLNDAGTSSGFMDGRIRELIIYNSDQSANRVAIETNINDAYSIY